MKFTKIILALALFTVLPLSSCDNNSSSEGNDCTVLETPDDLLSTPITDAYKFPQADSYATSSFTDDGLGAATFKSATDGDTANFEVVGYAETVRLRFLGINTPESTAQVQPWGKKASIFVKNILTSAHTIVLINDISVFEERDSSGNRHLGFIWYKPTAEADFRLLNLEIVEQCYSRNFLFLDSTLCPYRTKFEQAEARGIACGVRVHGAADPGFDYSDDVAEPTLRHLRDNYDEYGISEGGSSGKQLIISGLVIGQMGDSMVLRDITDVDEITGEYCSMYAYAGYNTSLASVVKVGDIIKIYCRATMYNNNIQLSDLQTNTTGDRKLEWLAFGPNSQFLEVFYPGEDVDPRYNSYPNDISAYEMNADDFTTYQDFAPYSGYVVSARVTIRYVTPAEDDEIEEGSGAGEQYYYKKDDSNNMTVYGVSSATGEPLYLNLRVSGQCYPYPNESIFTVGHTYLVVGYLASYFERYQIQLFNNTPGSNYITDVTQV
ncbi:MAG: thermonuclease family protein [Bacilli bacterium]|jgi:endonuclease YncB( thermonuclease family)